MSGAALGAARRYRSVVRPWPALVEEGAVEPAAYLARLARHTLNHGMPALRRPAPLWTAVGRRGLPRGAVRASVHLARPREHAATSDLVGQVVAGWPRLAAAATALPPEPVHLSALVLRRSGTRFVFLFGDRAHPLLVLKAPPGGGARDRREERRGSQEEAMRQAARAGVGPRLLPDVAGHQVQEGLAGAPVWVLPPGGRGWSAPYVPALDGLGAALVRLAGASAAPCDHPLLDRWLRTAAEHLPGRAGALVQAARRDLTGLDRGVLEHHDLSAQNWLVGPGGRFVGLVDWEEARLSGLPGYDAAHAAVSLLEHGTALRRWSQEHVLDAFRAAWFEEPLFVRARHWHRATVAEVGLGDRAEALHVAYYACRLARRLEGRGPQLLAPATLAAMVEVVTGG